MHWERTQMQFHRKKGFIIVFCLICTLGALWWSGKSEPVENAQIAFIGFKTNAPPVTSDFLVFRVSGVSGDVAWEPVALQQKEHGDWKPVPKPTGWWSHRKDGAYVVGVQSASTNGEWRISLSYQKRRTGFPGIYDRISEAYARVVKNRHYNLYGGATHLVTNNVDVGKAQQ